MKSFNRQREEQSFENPPIKIENLANADIVIGRAVNTASGAQVIPVTSVTIVCLGGGGEFGDVKTFKEAEGFKLAGGNGCVVTVKPKGFLIDDGKNCRLLRMEDGPVNALIEKTGELVHDLVEN